MGPARSALGIFIHSPGAVFVLGHSHGGLCALEAAFLTRANQHVSLRQLAPGTVFSRRINSTVGSAGSS